MTDKILGIDLGTSSVKLVYTENGRITKVRKSYSDISLDGWWEAICSVCRELDLTRVRAIGLSSQVGTYVVSGREVIGWNQPVGQDELDTVLSSVTRDEFMSEISMPHPRLLSYPLPRLIYIKKHFKAAKRIGMPKDLLCEKLTGEFVSDPFSWRGLANLKTSQYSKSLLKRFDLDGFELPRLSLPQSIVGKITPKASQKTGIPQGTPVCVGCNDFFSALLGMGILKDGDAFDITGTSEHFGVIRNSITKEDDKLVCGAYFFDNVHYGVTAHSGKATQLSLELDNLNYDGVEAILQKEPPIFLPYLNGERAPIWDPKAKGVYFGINESCEKTELAYSAIEGVLFSIYHIYQTMGLPKIQSITLCGGASKDILLNKLKASLFGVPVKASGEADASALGAQILASTSIYDYASLIDAVSDNCSCAETVLPDAELGKRLRARFEKYIQLYPLIKNAYNLFT